MKKWIFIKNYIIPILKIILPTYNFELIKTIIITGGYGYGNTGDEAQCNETVKVLTKNFPNYRIKVLSPKPLYTKQYHGFDSEFATRVAFWQHGSPHNCYNFKNSKAKRILFFIKGCLIYINSFLVKYNLPTFLIDAQASKLLTTIKESSLFYFSGGGYLTGSTEPRLWDGIFTCRICHVLNTPVVMSAQTIGVWKNKFNIKFAKWGFKYVKIITTRDRNYTINDLKMLDLKCPIFETHDDALFCEKINIKSLNEEYVVINFHYWNMEKDEQDTLKKKIKKIINLIPYKLYFIPMIKSDVNCYEDFIKTYGKILEIYNYDYDFRKIRGFISQSKICITMKHHPIIFAYGENIPVISLVKSGYYAHKNIGAQAQYNQEKYHVELDKIDYDRIFQLIFDDLNINYLKNIELIKKSKVALINNKNKFLDEIRKFL